MVQSCVTSCFDTCKTNPNHLPPWTSTCYDMNSGGASEQDKFLDAAAKLRAQYEAANLQLDRHMQDFANYKYDGEEFGEGEEIKPKDPAIVASDVAGQIVRPFSTGSIGWR